MVLLWYDMETSSSCLLYGIAVDSCYVYRQGVQIACKDLPTPEEAKILRKYDSESRVSDIYIVLLIFCTVCNVSIIECLLLNYCILLFVITGHIVFIYQLSVTFFKNVCIIH